MTLEGGRGDHLKGVNSVDYWRPKCLAGVEIGPRGSRSPCDIYSVLSTCAVSGMVRVQPSDWTHLLSSALPSRSPIQAGRDPARLYAHDWPGIRETRGFFSPGSWRSRSRVINTASERGNKMSTVIRDERVRLAARDLREKDVAAARSCVRPERVPAAQVDGEVGGGRGPGGLRPEGADESEGHARTVAGHLRLGLTCQRRTVTPAQVTGEEVEIKRPQNADMFRLEWLHFCRLISA